MAANLGGKTGRGHRELERGIQCWSVRGELTEAMSHFDSAMTWAMERGDSDLWDRAFCNRCAAEMNLSGTAGDWVRELREIVLRSREPETAFLAAYNVACAYERDKDSQRALFYARIAHDRCRPLGRRDWLVWSNNQIGNAQVAESRFEEACASYVQALRLLSDEPSVERSSILDNLGYCRIVQGRMAEGFTLLFEGLRQLRQLRHLEQPWRLEARLRLSLTYGYLEVGRLLRALQHATRALEIADHYGDDESIKNAHYLLGETHNELGHHATARSYFTRLQERFYPNASHVPDLLMAIDVRNLINLKA